NLHQTRSDLAPAWGHVVAQALQKEPDERFQSMQAFFNAAEQAASSRARRPSTAVAATSLVKLPNGNSSQSPKSNKMPWIAGVGVVLVGAIGFTLWTQRLQNGNSDASESQGPSLVESAAVENAAVSSPVKSVSDAAVVSASLVLDAAVPDARVLVVDAAPVVAQIATDAVAAEKVEAAPDAAVRNPVKTTKARKPVSQSRGTATLVVQSSPWAIVYLDGKKLGSTPRNEIISSGRHRVKLRSDFSDKPKSFKFTIKPGKTHTIRATWKP
ncbi:MAG: PEGA domain-containing protein, partial [Kofleriaceae bacterium]|nr:PEGA domain-containing protein [Kofleriaceae bacterium]